MSFLKKQILSFKFAFDGIADVYRSEVNLKIHVTAAVIVFFAGWYFNISTTEWCLVVLCIASVITAEMFNTALEYLTDLVTPEYHLLAQKTKDAAAGAVLIMAFGAAITGMIIFLPKLLTLFK